MRAAPVVSIVLPTFNRRQYLTATVASVLEQSFTDWELLIADDGSDVATREYLTSLRADPRISVSLLGHAGKPAVPRNAALRRARGRYVAFLDSDDVWARDKLARQVALMTERPGCRWSYTAFRNIDECGGLLAGDADRRWQPCEGSVFELILDGRVSLRTPSIMATRQLLAEAGEFDESLESAEDCDLWLRFALKSDVALLNEPLVGIRHHAHNHSRDWARAYIGQARTFLKLQADVDPARRALLRRERGRNALRLAAGHAVRGARGAAFRAVSEALPFSWTSLEWWRGALLLIAAMLLPGRLRLLLRRTGSRS